jgi:uncharacterized protein (DUF362 family)
MTGHPAAESSIAETPYRVNRRVAIGATGAVLTAGAIGALRLACATREPVFIASGQRYDGDLVTTIRDGLVATGMPANRFAGKQVLLKPNMVEPTREIPHMTTHPAVIQAAAEVFRSWGATVRVGEAPGHVRDTEMALFESGVDDALRSFGIEFADLNYEPVQWVGNLGGQSTLDGFFLPHSVVAADYIVSLPKLKSHHWVGMTASMKNLYGVLPGIKYGWPKNVLHHHGIPQTVVDICVSLPTTLAIIDAIDCMEGDGPILGSRKHLGLLMIGPSLPAVDATAARIMGLVPSRINYLRGGRKLGPISDRRIEQRGEAWQGLVQPFELLDKPHLRALQSTAGGSLVT